MKILFQGDSITDCGRDYANPYHLGAGYANYTARMIRENFPEMELEFFNLGIGGHRTADLKARWQTDCIDIQPDIVSIMIGINDVWRAFDSADPTSVKEFEDNYRFLLSEIKSKTSAKIVIIEPFVLHDTADKHNWHEDLYLKIAATRRLAEEFSDAYVPMNGLFTAKSVGYKAFGKSPSYWAADGVHPTEEGAYFIAGELAAAIAEII